MMLMTVDDLHKKLDEFFMTQKRVGWYELAAYLKTNLTSIRHALYCTHYLIQEGIWLQKNPQFPNVSPW